MDDHRELITHIERCRVAVKATPDVVHKAARPVCHTSTVPPA